MPKYCSDKYIGCKYNKITILSIIKGNSQRRKVIGKCDCGIIKEFWLFHVLHGKTKSCGCILKNNPGPKTHGLTNHPLYSVWSDMKSRCLNKKHKSYKSYGAKGVKICNEWVFDFVNFYTWAIANNWEPHLELDKDIKGNGFLYSPETCCFVPQIVNLTAKRNIRKYLYNEELITLKEISKKSGININTLRTRIYRTGGI